MITLVLADDHVVVRQGLRAMLAAQGDLQVLAEASDGDTAVDVVSRCKPDLLLVDVAMPGRSGLDVTREVAGVTRVLVLSMHGSPAYVGEALRRGASGYVLKDSDSEELLRAVRIVARGERYLCSAIDQEAVRAYLENAERAASDPFESLTPREREVLRLTVAGRSAAEVASQLCISPRTVEVHRANLMRKLGVRNVAELVRLAVEHSSFIVQEKSFHHGDTESTERG